MSDQSVLPAGIPRNDSLANRLIQYDNRPEPQVQLAIEPMVDVVLREVLIQFRCALGFPLAVMFGQDELAEDGRSAKDAFAVVGCGLQSVVLLGMDVVVKEVVAGLVGAGKVQVEERLFGI